MFCLTILLSGPTADCQNQGTTRMIPYEKYSMLVCALFGLRSHLIELSELNSEHGGTFLLQFGAWEDVDLSEEISQKL